LCSNAVKLRRKNEITFMVSGFYSHRPNPGIEAMFLLAQQTRVANRSAQIARTSKAFQQNPR
jgi:hypothetical protein